MKIHNRPKTDYTNPNNYDDSLLALLDFCWTLIHWSITILGVYCLAVKFGWAWWLIFLFCASGKLATRTIRRPDWRRYGP